MCTASANKQQLSFFGEDLLNQLDPYDPLLKLASVLAPEAKQYNKQYAIVVIEVKASLIKPKSYYPNLL